jgi:TonB family protein
VQKERKDKHFIKNPIYRGGRDALQKFIVTHLKYPKEALEKKIEGTVSLKYTIDYKGKVIESHIISGLGYGCDEEAMRLANMLRFEVPKTSRKVRVHFHKDLHIHFRLPKKNPAKQLQMTYQYTKKSSESKSGKVDSDGSYSYTITVSGD